MSENIYHLVGGHSYYQYFILLFIFVSQFNTSFNILMPIFINNYQDFLCRVEVNESNIIFHQNANQFKRVNNGSGILVIDSQRCNMASVTKICSDIYLNPHPMTSTIRSQFHLYCEYHWLSSIAVLSFMIGICLGSLLGGFFTDRFGRVAGCIISYLMISIFSTFAALVPWYTVYCVTRLLVGFAVSLSFISNNAMTLEIVELKQRTTFGFYWSIGYDFGYILLVFLSYLVRNHFILQIILCSVSYVSLIFPLFYKESFRWLLAHKKYDKAKEVLIHIAKFNKKIVNESQIDKVIQIFEDERKQSFVKTISFKEVFKFKIVMVNLCILWFIYFSSSFSYYTFVLGSSKISDEIFVATSISALSSLIIRSGYLFLCRRVGRIYILLSLQVGIVILFVGSMILKFFLGAKNIVTTILLMVSIALSSTNFGYMWIYGGEAFPTVIRATSVSIGSACARVSGMLASQMEWVFEVSPNALPIVGTVMAIIGSLCTVFILPETFKKPSLDFLPQAEKYFVEWRQPWRKRSEVTLEVEIKDFTNKI